ncbi:MAG: lysophospholipid acyltransferase family protein [Planctomycetes bacterium]|nr:lysophospholipid acyltransferase family protein [Planctomycetota bacterium]
MLLLKLLSLFARLLPLSLALKSGEVLGLLFHYLFPSRRRITLDNLRQAFATLHAPRSTLHALRYSPALIARSMARHMGRNAIEFLRLPALTKDNMDTYIKWSGLEHLDNALKLNKGAFVLTAHIGNWDLVASGYSLKGYKVNLITKHLRIEFLNRFWLASRAEKNIVQLYREGSIKEIINALKRNEIMGFILDQHTHKSDGILVDFFGRPCWTTPGLAVLAQRYDAPVVPSFIIRQPDGTHKVFVEPAIPFVEKDTQEETIRYNTQAYTNVLERYIRQYPDQWIWMHRRWKTGK